MSEPSSLQNLHSIMLPPDVGFLPLAPGWFLLGALFVLFTGQQILRHLRYKKANRYRQEALAKLRSLQLEYALDKAEHTLRELPILIKSCALKLYPRQQIAGLYGTQWLTFLDSSIDSNSFSQGVGSLLPVLSHCSPVELRGIDTTDMDKLFDLVAFWIQHHRPINTGGGFDD